MAITFVVLLLAEIWEKCCQKDVQQVSEHEQPDQTGWKETPRFAKHKNEK